MSRINGWSSDLRGMKVLHLFFFGVNLGVRLLGVKLDTLSDSCNKIDLSKYLQIIFDRRRREGDH